MIETPELHAGEIGVQLTRLWERNLGVISAEHDDYFHSGGDSLRGTQLLAWIQECFGVELSLLDLFESRTLHAQTTLLIDRLRMTATRSSEKPTTEYMFFGSERERLFGALHRPACPRSCAVVLCYPMGQEYMRIHRTYVELARLIAASGRYAFRFDYTGCGDSGGEAIAGDFTAWRDDIRRAVQETRRRTGARAIVAVGGRIGANLLLDVAPALELAGVVLWEPVVDGAEYLASLRRVHHDLLHGNAELDGYDDHPLGDGLVELVGFPLTKRLYDQVAQLDLRTSSHPGVPALVLANSPKQALERYVSERKRDAVIEYVSTDESDGIWLAEDRQNKGVIPARAVQEIVSWIARRDA